jgi:hypothetical protein
MARDGEHFQELFFENMAPEIIGTIWLFIDYYSYTIGSRKMKDSTCRDI